MILQLLSAKNSCSTYPNQGTSASVELCLEFVVVLNLELTDNFCDCLIRACQACLNVLSIKISFVSNVIISVT